MYSKSLFEKGPPRPLKTCKVTLFCKDPDFAYQTERESWPTFFTGTVKLRHPSFPANPSRYGIQSWKGSSSLFFTIHCGYSWKKIQYPSSIFVPFLQTIENGISSTFYTIGMWTFFQGLLGPLMWCSNLDSHWSSGSIFKHWSNPTFLVKLLNTWKVCLRFQKLARKLKTQIEISIFVYIF